MQNRRTAWKSREDSLTTLKFLRAAISFISNENNMCADLTNAAFIISQPGKEFIIQAGNGDWELFFSEEAEDVHGRCVPEGLKSFQVVFGRTLGSNMLTNFKTIFFSNTPPPFY